jgi:hypothetical protein
LQLVEQRLGVFENRSTKRVQKRNVEGAGSDMPNDLSSVRKPGYADNNRPAGYQHLADFATLEAKVKGVNPEHGTMPHRIESKWIPDKIGPNDISSGLAQIIFRQT